MEKEGKKVEIRSLSPERQRVVRRIRNRIRKGEYILSSRIVDPKTIEGVLEDILAD